MITKGALIISILLQFFAAIMALSLTKRTKYNASWILISIGFLFMAIRRAIDLLPYYFGEYTFEITQLQLWMGIITSVLIAIGVIYIKKIFSFLENLNRIRAQSEKKVLNAIIRTEEQQKKRFAKDLHDGLGPLLSTVKMSLSAMEENLSSEQQNKILQNTRMVTDEAINAIKEISNDISPHILNNFGLVSAINSFIEKLPPKTSTKIHFTNTIKDQRLDYSIEVILYRVICELIHNSVKHASANNLNLSIANTNQQLRITYSDDGVGFDPKNIKKSNSKGMGMHNMSSRINSLDGSIQIESDTGKGIFVYIQIPIIQSPNKG